MTKSGLNNLKMKTADFSAENIEKIAELFPNVVTEIEDENGVLCKGIDFDILRQELSGEAVEGREERYEFTWVGKRQSIVEANLPIQKTLRPLMDESLDWENTKNIYIEGDNLDALKLLQESYLNKVKMIYIDPPYNTGNDFIYNDSFVMEKEEYDEESGAIDEVGNRLIKNNKDRGRYHSDWCSMLYPRLKLAHNLLKEDGVIFVSIDDNEVHNLRKMMDEVFGEDNFVATYVWKARAGKDHTAQYASISQEYVLCYSKEKSSVQMGKDIRERTGGNYSDDRGNYKREQLRQWGTHDRREDRPTMYYPILAPDGTQVFPLRQDGSEGCWRISQNRMKDLLESGNVDFVLEQGVWRLYAKQRDGAITKTAISTLFDDVGTSSTGTLELKSIFEDKVFPTTKPTGLVHRLFEIANAKSDDIILDFFSGSATTAHAVMKLNAEDCGDRRFIMVQLPEACSEESEAYKAGFKTIADIGKERIRRAGRKIKEEIEEENKQAKLGGDSKKVPDIGFRVFKIDDTNMKDVYYSAGEYSQETIEGLIDNVKEERSDIDLLYQVLIDWGLSLDLKHEIENIDGFNVHIVDTDALAACFESNIPESVMRKIAAKKPLRAVFRDGSFKSSPQKLNIEGIFKTTAPDTKLRVI
ncbi:MAG: site-specific DNA-methyltransferase [Methanomicrobium sp.]|nr:site-specific DNA-methyltransferase [Methanomicrobium sp.]